MLVESLLLRYLIISMLCLIAGALASAEAPDAEAPAAFNILTALREQIHPNASLFAGANYQQVLNGAQLAKPSSLWWDPAFRTQRDYITEQITLLNRIEGNQSPLFPLLEQAQGFLLGGYTCHLPSGMPDMCWVADLGPAAPAWQAWFEQQFARQENLEPQEIRGFSGYTPNMSRDGSFIGFQESRVLAGYARRCENTFGLGINQTLPNSALFLSISLKQILRELAFIAKNKRDTFGFNSWGEMTRGVEPQLQIEVSVQGQQWMSRLELTQFGSYEFKPIGQRIRASVPRGAQLWGLVHLDLERLVSRLIASLEEQHLMLINQRLGFPLHQLPKIFSGDLMLAGRAGAGLPEAFFAAHVLDVERLEACLNSVLMPYAKKVNVKGTSSAWAIKLPSTLPQIVTIAIKDDMLVCTNNQFKLDDMFSRAEPFATTAVQNESAYLHVDTPALGKIFLPLLWAFLPQYETQLCEPVLQTIYWPLNDALLETLEAEDREQAINDILSEWQKQRLRVIFPSENMGKACAESFGLWFEEEDSNPVIICRSAAGYHRIGHHSKILSLEQAEKIVGNNVHRAGPKLEALPEIDIPATPYFNKHWLPPMDKAIEYLPVYQVRVDSGHIGAATMHENGLPILGIGGGFLATALWIRVNELKAFCLRNQARRDQD